VAIQGGVASGSNLPNRGNLKKLSGQEEKLIEKTTAEVDYAMRPPVSTDPVEPIEPIEPIEP
jgi:hypothetical protein